MKNIVINNIEYNIEKDYNDAIVIEELNEKITDYFDSFDYIVGDWSYGKLRLKGFYNSDNKKVKDINNIKNLEKYLKDYCSYGCKYFVLSKKK